MKHLLLILLILLPLPVSAQELEVTPETNSEATAEVTPEPFPPDGWQMATRARLTLITRGERAAALTAQYEPIYERMVVETGREPEINLIIVEDGLLPGCADNGEATPVMLVEATPEACSVDLHGFTILEPSDGVERALLWALFERFYAVERMPAWFAAGLADFYATAPRPERLLRSRDTVRSGRVFTLAEMERASGDPLWRAQSYGMILYMLDRLGVDGLFDLAAELGEGEFRGVYERRVGEPLASLVPFWQSWIFSHAAEAAYGVTPYQAPTAIPTLTDTRIPTVTASPTETPAILSTATPRRAPTLTPSQTPTLAPPTVTPRPPGSALIQPTEVPPTTAQFASPQISIAVVLIVLLVILLFVYVVLSYRR